MVEQNDKDMMDGPLALVGETRLAFPQQKQKQKQMAEHGEAWTKCHDRSSIIIISKDEKDWIDPETGVPYAGFELGDINMITMKNILKFKNSVIVLHDMGDKVNKDIVYFFTDGRKEMFN